MLCACPACPPGPPLRPAPASPQLQVRRQLHAAIRQVVREEQLDPAAAALLYALSARIEKPLHAGGAAEARVGLAGSEAAVAARSRVDCATTVQITALAGLHRLGNPCLCLLLPYPLCLTCTLCCTLPHPLSIPAGTCALYRQLLRLCASQRAALASAADPALPHLNIMIVVAGAYFGQDEELATMWDDDE